MNPDELFAEHRAYLFAVAYRLLGIAEDAEDVVQDAWLRFANVDPDELESPRAFLVTVVTRLALDLLRSARRRREDYVGVWLPEPVPTSEALPPDLVDRAETASFAFLLMLERLNPVERAAVVLHDVFGYSHQEIASTIERSTDASRQALRRARQKLSGAPRRLPAPSEHGEALAEQFVKASASGDIDELLATLASDVVLMSDGGGKAQAASRPLAGLRRVGRFLSAVSAMAPENVRVHPSELNGQPAMLIFEEGRLTTAFLFDATADGITAIYAVRNPDKLRRVIVDSPERAR
jgi:RNA polymerase sigma-70 factor (ECF subfamily)